VGFDQKRERIGIYTQKERGSGGRYLKGGCPVEVKETEQRIQGNTGR
jgi:hypothetical protein